MVSRLPFSVNKIALREGSIGKLRLAPRGVFYKIIQYALKRHSRLC